MTGVATAEVPVWTVAAEETVLGAVLFTVSGGEESSLGLASTAEPAPADVAEVDGVAGGKLVVVTTGCGTSAEETIATGARFAIVVSGREESVGELAAAGTATCATLVAGVGGKDVPAPAACGVEVTGTADGSRNLATDVTVSAWVDDGDRGGKLDVVSAGACAEAAGKLFAATGCGV